VAEKLGGRVLFAPLMWLGNSDHHLDFPGTLSAAPRCYLDMLNSLAENFVHHGFRRLIFLNGHGGNDVPGKQAVFELRQKHRQRHDLLLLFATYWNAGTGTAGIEAGCTQTEMGHACEWETSMILRIAPHLVDDYASAPDVDPGRPFLPATRGWVTQDRSVRGHIGSPRLASAEKGEKLFQSFARDVASLLERVLAWNGKDWNG
jgi:creatinine amidohydrolase